MMPNKISWYIFGLRCLHLIQFFELVSGGPSNTFLIKSEKK